MRFRRLRSRVLRGYSSARFMTKSTRRRWENSESYRTEDQHGRLLLAGRAVYAGQWIGLMARLIASTRAVEAYYRAFEHTLGWREVRWKLILPAMA